MHALDTADDQCCARKERAGIARTDEGIALAVCQHVQTDRHGRTVFIPHNAERRVLHVDHDIGVHDFNIRKIQPVIGGDLLDRLAVSDHHDGHAEFIPRPDRAADQLARCVVAAHHINDNSHVHTPHF